MLWIVIQIAIGGALGAVGRYFTGVAFARVLGTGFPYGTLTINVVGSLLVGILFVVLGGLNGETGRHAPFLITGFLGGFTTFSAYSLDSWILFQQGRVSEAVTYAVGSAILSILAVFAGIALARQFHG